jgi:hypothetical protein
VTDYLELDLTADATALYQDGVDYIQSIEPAWTPSVIEAWLLSVVARMAVEVVILAGRVPLEIFQFFGHNVLRIAPEQASTATGTARITLVDTAGHTVPAGAQLDVGGVAFQTVTDTTAPAGASTVDVPIVAVDAGANGSGLTGSVGLVAPTLIWVDSITLVGQTTGGADGETPDDYVNRLPDELPTLSPKVVLIADAESRARRNPTVMRALALDNYIPAGPGGSPPAVTNAEGAITVAVHDASGADPGSAVRGDIQADIESNRIAGITAAIIPPTYTRLDVEFTATAQPGWDASSVEVAVRQALLDYLSPVTWGATGADDPTGWQDEPTVYRNDLIGVVKSVRGVRHVESLTLARYGGTQGTADITLDGPASLPALDTAVSGTVT